MSTARRHHYVPQGYLAAFTDTGTKEGQFCVMEVESGDCFSTSPKNVGVARDFNRVDADGQPIDALESALASFEGEAVEVIRKVLLSQTFPDAGSFGGVRAAMTLRCMLAEMGMSSIASIFPVPKVQAAFGEDGTPKDPDWHKRADTFMEELEWYARAMKTERDKPAERSECEAQAPIAVHNSGMKPKVCGSGRRT